MIHPEPFQPDDPEVIAVRARHANIPQDALPCFEPDPPPAATTTVANKPRWSHYTVKRTVRCDDCTTALALAKGDGPIARPARFQRRHGDDRKLVCTLHMEERTRSEGREPLPDDNEFSPRRQRSRR